MPLPAGFTLEQETKLPKGFQLEKPSLPEGFKLETEPSKGPKPIPELRAMTPEQWERDKHFIPISRVPQVEKDVYGGYYPISPKLKAFMARSVYIPFAMVGTLPALLYGMAVETYFQTKGVAVSLAKKEPIDWLEPRRATELFPEGTPEWLRFAGGAGEMIVDMALLGYAARKGIPEKVAKTTIKVAKDAVAFPIEASNYIASGIKSKVATERLINDFMGKYGGRVPVSERGAIIKELRAICNEPITTAITPEYVFERLFKVPSRPYVEMVKEKVPTVLKPTKRIAAPTKPYTWSEVGITDKRIIRDYESRGITPDRVFAEQMAIVPAPKIIPPLEQTPLFKQLGLDAPRVIVMTEQGRITGVNGIPVENAEEVEKHLNDNFTLTNTVPSEKGFVSQYTKKDIALMPLAEAKPEVTAPIEPSKPTIPLELQLVADEVRKYKSPNEFLNKFFKVDLETPRIASLVKPISKDITLLLKPDNSIGIIYKGKEYPLDIKNFYTEAILPTSEIFDIKTRKEGAKYLNKLGKDFKDVVDKDLDKARLIQEEMKQAKLYISSLPKERVGYARTWIGWIRAKGGLDPILFSKDYDLKAWMQNGMTATLKKGGDAPDIMASKAIEEGLLPSGSTADDLYRVLLENKGRLLPEFEEKKLEKEQFLKEQEIYKEEQKDLNIISQYLYQKDFVSLSPEVQDSMYKQFVEGIPKLQVQTEALNSYSQFIYDQDYIDLTPEQRQEVDAEFSNLGRKFEKSSIIDRPFIFFLVEPIPVINTDGKEVVLNKGENYFAYPLEGGKYRITDTEKAIIYEGELDKITDFLLKEGEQPLGGGVAYDHIPFEREKEYGEERAKRLITQYPSVKDYILEIPKEYLTENLFSEDFWRDSMEKLVRLESLGELEAWHKEHQAKIEALFKNQRIAVFTRMGLMKAFLEAEQRNSKYIKGQIAKEGKTIELIVARDEKNINRLYNTYKNSAGVFQQEVLKLLKNRLASIVDKIAWRVVGTLKNAHIDTSVLLQPSIYAKEKGPELFRDLRQDAWERGWLPAMQRHDPSKGPFLTYAWHWANKAVMEAFPKYISDKIMADRNFLDRVRLLNEIETDLGSKQIAPTDEKLAERMTEVLRERQPSARAFITPDMIRMYRTIGTGTIISRFDTHLSDIEDESDKIISDLIEDPNAERKLLAEKRDYIEIIMDELKIRDPEKWQFIETMYRGDEGLTIEATAGKLNIPLDKAQKLFESAIQEMQGIVEDKNLIYDLPRLMDLKFYSGMPLVDFKQAFDKIVTELEDKNEWFRQFNLNKRKLLFDLLIPYQLAQSYPEFEPIYYAMQNSVFHENYLYSFILEKVPHLDKITNNPKELQEAYTELIWRGNDKDRQAYFTSDELRKGVMIKGKLRVFNEAEIQGYLRFLEGRKHITDLFKYMWLVKNGYLDPDKTSADRAALRARLNKYVITVEGEVFSIHDTLQEASNRQKELRALGQKPKINLPEIDRLGGYWGIRRKGDWRVYAFDPSQPTDMQINYRSFETRGEAKRFAEELKKLDFNEVFQKLKPDDMPVGKWFRMYNPTDDLREVLYAPVSSMEIILDVAERAGVLGTKEIQSMLDVLKSRTILRHLMHRNWTLGYERTWENAVQSYLEQGQAITRWIARDKAFNKIPDLIEQIKQKDLRAWADTWYQGYKRVDKLGWQQVREFIYTWHLAFNLTWLIQNSLQPFITTLRKVLIEIRNPIKAGKIFLQAYQLAGKDIKNRMGAFVKKETPEHLAGVDPELAAFLDYVWRSGITGAHFVQTFFGVANTETIRKVKAVLGSFASASEAVDRTHALLAGWLVGKEKGLTGDRLWRFAIDFVGNTQYWFGRHNQPGFIQKAGWFKPGAQILYIFYGFWSNFYVGLGRDMGKGTRLALKRDPKALNYALGVLSTILTSLILAGIVGLPGFALLDRWAKTKGFDFRRWLRKKFPRKVATALISGSPNLLGADLSASLSLDPTEKLFRNWEDSVVAVSMIKGMGRAWKDLHRGYGERMIWASKPVSPRVVRNIPEAYYWGVTGRAETFRGERLTLGGEPWIPSKGEIAWKTFGFTPTAQREAWEEIGSKKYIQKFITEQKIKYADEIAIARIENNFNRGSKRETEIWQEINNWNINHPDMKISIDMGAIAERQERWLRGKTLKGTPKLLRPYLYETEQQFKR